MALNYIWTGFFLVGFIAALAQWVFLGDTEIFKRIIDGTFDAAKMGVMDIALPLAGVMTLWLGIMNIGEKAGAVGWLAKVISPFFSRIFPEVPKDHPATGHMVMNFSANLLGLDNAATPFGLKAMISLQELNPVKGTASNAQIMFMVLHASGLTIIPVSIIAQRAILKSTDPTSIFIPCMIATFAATVVALTVVAIKQRINLFQPAILLWVGGISALIGLLVFVLRTHSSYIDPFSKIFSNGLILLLFVVFIIGGMIKKVNVYDAFIDGAKEGFQVAVTIIPYFNCGKCIACTTGAPNCCESIRVCGVHVDGGMVEYSSVPASSLVHGEGLSFDELALTEPLAIGAHGVRRAGVKPGEFVLVAGAGPIGLATMEFARIAGGTVIAMDVNEQRLQFCKEKLSIVHTIDARSSNIVDTLREITHGDMPAVVIDATGNLNAINNAFQYMAHAGRYVLIGLQKGDIRFSHPEFHKREGTLMSSRNATRQDFDHVMNSMKRGLVSPTTYISHRVKFDNVAKEFESFLDPANGVIKAMVELD